jgi:signal transduction histidine kinase
MTKSIQPITRTRVGGRSSPIKTVMPTNTSDPSRVRGLTSLSRKLMATHVALGVVLTVLALLASLLIYLQAEKRRTANAARATQVQSLYMLVASASEEGFSYVVSGDSEERESFRSKMAKASATNERLRSLGEPVTPVTEALGHMGRAGEALFAAHDRRLVLDREAYDAFEGSIDGAWQAVSSLDNLVSDRKAASMEQTQRERYLLTCVIGLFGTALAFVWSSWLGRRIARPIRDLRDAALAFGEGHHDVPIDVRTNDEVGELASAFERMRRQVVQRTTELASSHAELARSHEELQGNLRALLAAEKLAAMGRLTAAVAHELNSPLAAILTVSSDQREITEEYLRLLTAGSAADPRAVCEEMREALEIVESAARRAAGFVKSLRSQSRQSQGKPEHFSARSVVADAVTIAAVVARPAKCQIEFEASAEDVQLIGDPSRLGQAVTNLLQNAVDATAERGGGRITVAIKPSPHDVRIEVADSGTGIGPEAMPRLFQALYTTKPYGLGTGLGLVIVKEATEHDFGGRVDVQSTVGRGSTFTLVLPRPAAPRALAA